jgi:ABC-type transport system involved in cytochrome c biogenesis permease subunit
LPLMVPALIAAAASVIVAIIALVGERKPARNDHDLAQQEADLLKKLEQGSQAASKLQSLINRRISRWVRRDEMPRIYRLIPLFALLSVIASTAGLALYFYLQPPSRESLEINMVALIVTGVIWLLTTYVLLWMRRRHDRWAESLTHSPDHKHPAADATSTGNTP